MYTYLPTYLPAFGSTVILRPVNSHAGAAEIHICIRTDDVFIRFCTLLYSKCIKERERDTKRERLHSTTNERTPRHDTSRPILRDAVSKIASLVGTRTVLLFVLITQPYHEPARSGKIRVYVLCADTAKSFDILEAREDAREKKIEEGRIAELFHHWFSRLDAV